MNNFLCGPKVWISCIIYTSPIISPVSLNTTKYHTASVTHRIDNGKGANGGHANLGPRIAYSDEKLQEDQEHIRVPAQNQGRFELWLGRGFTWDIIWGRPARASLRPRKPEIRC
jgi:hypothetical protein